MYTKLGKILGLAIVLVGLTSLVAYDLAASSIDGKIVALSTPSSEITVEIPSGTNMVFTSDPQTIVMLGNESKKVVDLKVGDTVKVEYTASGSVNTATDIEVVRLNSWKSPNPNNSHADGIDGDDTHKTVAYVAPAKQNTDSAYVSPAPKTDSPYKNDAKPSTETAYDTNRNTDMGHDTERNTDVAHDAAVPSDANRDMANHDMGTATRSAQLPKTASSLPLVGLVGLLFVGAAVSIRVFRMMLS
jgi:hypothetical protein